MGITVSDFLKINNPNVFDIRSVQKYNDNHIPNSINVDYSKLISTPDRYMNMENTYYIYCQKGILSNRVVNYLRNMGYNVFEIIGGYESYVLNKNY